MHRPEYVLKIEAAARLLEIEVTHLSDKFAIRLRKNGVTKYIIGNTFPLNDAPCYKIAGNKNLCSDLLSECSVPNVPHQVIFSPVVMERRGSTVGSGERIRSFVETYGFPLVVKKNVSTKGQGVLIVRNEAELEGALHHVFATDSTLCLSPFRDGCREYRNIVLDEECLLSYEKQLPRVVGDGAKTVMELFAAFVVLNARGTERLEKLVDRALASELTRVPRHGEQVLLQWRHNRAVGTRYELADIPKMRELAVDAAKAIGARFASVDVVQSETYGLEVLEMSPSVSIHFPIVTPGSAVEYDQEIDVYRRALGAVFFPT